MGPVELFAGRGCWTAKSIEIRINSHFGIDILDELLQTPVKMYPAMGSKWDRRGLNISELDFVRTINNVRIYFQRM